MRRTSRQAWSAWAGTHRRLRHRPSARGRGIATWALQHVLRHADEAALERALLVCANSNAASIRTIERCGGVLDRTVDDAHGPLRHYWIRL